MTIEFKAWPKIPRFQNETFVITEKIDGSNACVIVDTMDNVYAQSRTRIITPGKQTDNYGFAQWVADHSVELLQLGPGYHYGEWWVNVINRGYDQTQKRFSLFAWYHTDVPECCGRVPVFEKGTTISDAVDDLIKNGSKAAPGFMRPEGVVVRSNHYGNALYKVIIDK